MNNMLHRERNGFWTPTPAEPARDWRSGLPVLRGMRASLRELRVSDAPSLFAMLTSEEVTRFMAQPPSTVEGFERFVQWASRQRAAGKSVCLAVTTSGDDSAVGIVQVRRPAASGDTAEWGFAIGSVHWGTGLFQEAARLMLDFAFDVMGMRRLEARVALRNGRGSGALRKLGAVQECILRRSSMSDDEHLNQALWAILAEDRRWTLSGRMH